MLANQPCGPSVRGMQLVDHIIIPGLSPKHFNQLCRPGQRCGGVARCGPGLPRLRPPHSFRHFSHRLVNTEREGGNNAIMIHCQSRTAPPTVPGYWSGPGSSDNFSAAQRGSRSHNQGIICIVTIIITKIIRICIMEWRG